MSNKNMIYKIRFFIKVKILYEIRCAYVFLFHRCKKCGKKIHVHDGFWDRTKAKYPVIPGYYCVDCGTIHPKSKKQGFLPF